MLPPCPGCACNITTAGDLSLLLCVYLDSILPSGTYEAIPYVIFESNDIVPEHLLDALDSGYDEFSEKYFNYPIYRTGGKFIVTE